MRRYPSLSPVRRCCGLRPWRAVFAIGALLGVLHPWTGVPAAEFPNIRVGVLKFGTVNWELQVMQDRGLARQEGVVVKAVPLAGKDATGVALQGGAVDIIVHDWLWVSRQRAAGKPYTFVPYSLAVGSVVVRPDAGIKTLADLRGKRLGVAGGPADKSWLLLRAYAKKTLYRDLADLARPDFAAPPLLNELMRKGDLPAVLNFWHYSARLKAAGMRELITIQEILPALGVEHDLPLIGWVFDETCAGRNRAAVEGFLRASRKAKEQMAQSDQVWETLRPLMGAENEGTFRALRDGYRAGIPAASAPGDERDIAAAGRVFQILADVGGEELVGKGSSLAPGTF